MKKILFIIAFLFTVFANAQGGPKVDVVKFRGEVTTTVRNTFDVPTGERWLIWNVTTSQFEHAGSDDVWSALDTTVADDQTASEVNITDSGGYFTGTEVETALQEVGADLATQSDDQTASEVNITDSGNNYTGTTVETALAEVADSIAIKANSADVINWNPVPSGGSNKIITNTVDEVKASNITASSSGGVDFISSLGTIGLTPTDSPPFNAKGWMYMDDSESKLKVSDGVSLKNIPYEEGVLLKDTSNPISSTTTIVGSNSEGISVNPSTGVTTVRGGDGSQFSRLIFSSSGITMDGVSEAEMLALGGSAILNANAIDNKIAAATLPSTAQQYYVIGASAKDTISDADYSASAEYKALFYRNIDTLEAGDGVTFATHGNKPVMVQPTTKDSTYIKKADGVDFFVAGQKAAITGDGLIVKNRNTAVGYKEGADAWYWSGDLTVHTEAVADPIDTMTGIVASWREDDLVAGVTTDWTDRINSITATANGGITASSDGSGGVEFSYDGVDDSHHVSTYQSVYDFVPQTDEFSIVVKFGSSVPTSTIRAVYLADGSGDGNAQYAIRRQSSTVMRGYAGGTFQEQTISDTDLTNDIIIYTFSTTTMTLYQNGTQIEFDGITATFNNDNTRLTFAATGATGTDFETAVTIKDVLIFNKVLSAGEISTIQSNL